MKQAATPRFVRYAHPSQAALDSIVILRLFSAGEAQSASVLRALRHLEYIYGLPIKGAVALFRRALSVPDPVVQKEILFEAMTAIIDWIFREPYKAAAWETALRLGRAFKITLLDLAAPLLAWRTKALPVYIGIQPYRH